MTKQIRIKLPKLHAAQQKVHDEAKRFNVLDCGRRFGKTSMAIYLVVMALLAGQPVAWFSPTYKMLEDVWRQINERIFLIIQDKSEQEHRIETITGGILDMWSLDAADAARGRKYALVIVDEAAMVANLMDIWNLVIRPMLMDLEGDAWFFSTPKGRNGFYKLHLFGRDEDNRDWKSWVFPSWANPYLPKAEIEALKETMTEEAYRQEILAEFLENAGSVFRNIAAATMALVNDSPTNHIGHNIIAGVDWGKQNDFTAISIGCAQCRRELALDRFNQIDYSFQVTRLAALFHTWNVKDALIELNSIGQPLFEQLQRMGLSVSGFTTTGQTKPPLIEGLALDIEKGSILLLPHVVATSELEAYERTVSPSTQRSSYSAPEGYHDDTVIARALMVKKMSNYPVSRQDIKQTQSPLMSLVGGR